MALETLRRRTSAQILHVPAQDVLTSLGIFTISLAAFLPFAPLDPDPQHDGAHFTVALAIAEGWRVHADVGSGYGPVTALLHGILLESISPKLLVLRVFNSILLAGVAASAYGISRLLSIRRLPALLLSLVWVLLSPAWGVFADALPLWPWPSVLFTLCAQLSVFLLLLALRGSKTGPLLFSASAFASLAVMIRANQGVPFVLSLLLAFLVAPQGRQLLQRHKWTLALGAIAPQLLLLTYLQTIGALQAAIHDTLIGPISSYLLDDLDPTSRVTAPINLPALLIEVYAMASLPFLLIACGVLIVLVRWTWSTRSLVAFAAVATVLGLAFASIGYYGLPRSIYEALPGEKLPLATLNALGVTPLYSAAVGIVMAGMVWIIAAIRERQWPLSLAATTVLFASLSFTTQLVPRWDVYHLWWTGPLMLITCFYFITRHLNGPQQIVMACVISLPYGLLATYSWYNTLTADRVAISDGPLQGMQVLRDRKPIVSNLSRSLAVIPERSAYFMCDDGMVAAFNGIFLSDRPNYVQVGWSNQPKPNQEPSFIVTCVDSPQDVIDTESRIPDNYQLIDGPIRMDLSPWSQTELRIYGNNSVS